VRCTDRTGKLASCGTASYVIKRPPIRNRKVARLGSDRAISIFVGAGDVAVKLVSIFVVHIIVFSVCFPPLVWHSRSSVSVSCAIRKARVWAHEKPCGIWKAPVGHHLTTLFWSSRPIPSQSLTPLCAPASSTGQCHARLLCSAELRLLTIKYVPQNASYLIIYCILLSPFS
jgi:hypothetical protein